MSLLRSSRRVIPIALAVAVLGGSLTEASALGKRNKPWQRSGSSKVETAHTPTANVASSRSSKKRKGLFRRSSSSSRERAKPQPARTTSRQSSRVQVRATATPTRTTTRAQTRTVAQAPKKRQGLLARMFKPEPRKKKPQTSRGNVAVARKKTAPGAPNAVQAPPRFNSALISQAKSKGSSVVVNIAKQRAYVYVGGQVAIDTPVSTARSGKRTPRGTFGVGERIRSGKISNIYHVSMPYWMRLGSSAYGMHAGYLPGYPASAGCIRMPYAAAQKVFDTTKYGTRVRIVGG